MSGLSGRIHHPLGLKAPTRSSVVSPVKTAAPNSRTAPYFTDASALTPAFGNPPTIILEPGDAAKAHQTDEYCSVQGIREAAEIYSRLAARWSMLK